MGDKNEPTQKNNLSKLRKQLSLTQDAFADLVGYNTSTIQKWESGERPLAPGAALEICKRIDGVTLDFLYCKDGADIYGAARILSAMREYFNFSFDKDFNRYIFDINDMIIELFQKIREIEQAIQSNPVLSDMQEMMIDKILSEYNGKIKNCDSIKRYVLFEDGDAKVAEWKKEQKTEHEIAAARVADMEYELVLKSELDRINFTSEYAKQGVKADIKAMGLPVENGMITGFSDALNTIKELHTDAFARPKASASALNSGTGRTSMVR